jgi:hypothetical protein
MTARQFSICDAEQRSDQWYKDRAGRITGSIADAVQAAHNTASYSGTLFRLAVERITGEAEKESFTGTKAMKHGVAQEPKSRRAVEIKHQLLIRESGFLKHHLLGIGYSPDGDADDFETLIELKNPNSSTHMAYLEKGGIPTIYKRQCMHGLIVTGAPQVLFASYDDRIPNPKLHLFSVMVKARDIPELEQYYKDLILFDKAIDEKVAYLNELGTRGDPLPTLQTVIDEAAQLPAPSKSARIKIASTRSLSKTPKLSKENNGLSQ